MLLKSVVDALGTNMAYLSAPLEGRAGVGRMFAMWDAGVAAGPVDFRLEGTPCGEVLQRGELFLDSGLSAQFPTFEWLAARNENAFMGRRLHSFDGEPLGVLGTLNPQELAVSDPERRALFDVFVSLAEMQLERMKLLERLDGVPRGFGRRIAEQSASAVQGTTIMVFDDDTRIRQVLSRELVTQGHEPVMVDSPEQLLRINQQFTPGVVLLDTGRPGADLAHWIDGLRHASPDVRVVLLTGDTDISARRVAQLGADSVLLKPFTPEQLRAAIEALLDPAKATN